MCPSTVSPLTPSPTRRLHQWPDAQKLSPIDGMIRTAGTVSYRKSGDIAAKTKIEVAEIESVGKTQWSTILLMECYCARWSAVLLNGALESMMICRLFENVAYFADNPTGN